MFLLFVSYYTWDVGGVVPAYTPYIIQPPSTVAQILSNMEEHKEPQYNFVLTVEGGGYVTNQTFPGSSFRSILSSALDAGKRVELLYIVPGHRRYLCPITKDSPIRGATLLSNGWNLCVTDKEQPGDGDAHDILLEEYSYARRRGNVIFNKIDIPNAVGQEGVAPPVKHLFFD